MADEEDTVMFYAPPISGLKRIPLEILLRITSFLDTKDLCNVRLTCRALERSLDTTFVNEFFTRKQFMISEDSLACLIAIARSRLGPHLRHVHFGLEHYPRMPRITGTDETADVALIARHASMFTLWATGNHRDMLADAFAHLSNLEHVVIRSFNSEKRSRDGYGRQWTSYGARTAGEELGYSIIQGANCHDELDNPFCSQVFAAVVAALGQAEARPSGIEVMARGRHHQIKNFAFNIPPYMEHSVVPVVEHLENLHLDIDLTPRSWSNPGHRIQSEENFMLRKFLSYATRLKHLRLNGIQNENQDDKPLLKWLASPSSASVDPNLPEVVTLPGPEFPRLEELNLGRMRMEGACILAVVRKFAPTLTRLELVNLTLEEELPPGHDWRDGDPKANFCLTFLAQLRDIPGLHLHHIGLRNVQQRFRMGARDKRKVSFNGEAHMAYTGPDWRHFVSDMIPKTKVEQEPETRNSNNPGNFYHQLDDAEDDGIWEQYALEL
ncbi:hypothetical protein B0T10DRAFT_265007 [Thelonectria olida]|uniref:F-box domain-containing protein n=1 Tax=Thelonectria olida TaxID=1576542 RepID=A0A9P8W7H1_9HYPO|nr:hypothetical protein B0T10DRAFT_265007 [Thelonectria olida]